jgi:hypothetical protein
MVTNLLKGKKGLIFGALNDKSIAWHVAEQCHEQGAELVLTNTAVALRIGDTEKLAKKTNSIVIPADATNIADLENLFNKTMEHFNGKIDFLLHAIGMSPNVRKKNPYDDINYSYYMQTLDISAISFHKILQTAKKLDAINEWGSIVALTYVAAHRTLHEYNDMADAKATLENIASNNCTKLKLYFYLCKHISIFLYTSMLVPFNNQQPMASDFGLPTSVSPPSLHNIHLYLSALQANPVQQPCRLSIQQSCEH